MAISEHPQLGTVLICDFSGFLEPEMVKRRPVVVVSPKIRFRAGLCTVVALSTTPPDRVMPYHCQVTLDPPLPPPWRSGPLWVKGDMVYAVGYHRLDFVRMGKSRSGRQTYRYEPLPADDLSRVRQVILSGLGLASLTRHIL